MGRIGSAGFDSTFRGAGEVSLIRVDGHEVLGVFDESFVLFAERREDIAESVAHGGWVVAVVGPGASLPAEIEFVGALDGGEVGCGRGVEGHVVGDGLLDGDAAAAFEVFFVPFHDFGAGEEGVVAAGVLCWEAAGDVVVAWVEDSVGVGGILELAVLRSSFR